MKKNRILVVNDITSHLVERHKLLEKDNEYGISAREFYREFIGQKDYKA